MDSEKTSAGEWMGFAIMLGLFFYASAGLV